VLQDTGFEHLVVAVADGTATISGVVPFEEAAGGFFTYSAPLRDALLDIEGIEKVIPHLQLRGDEASLRSQLTALIDATPIVFASNSADLDEAATAALDQAADIIIAHPGLRVLIAGHADTVGATVPNEELAAARGAVVLQYLVGRGVPVTRMQVVSYGELFPGQDEGIDRRVEFEVAP
jgi:outer membrane protein OmpA-like peptidoglycan-associated protein